MFDFIVIAGGVAAAIETCFAVVAFQQLIDALELLSAVVVAAALATIMWRENILQIPAQNAGGSGESSWTDENLPHCI